jgi:hypothetical protein
MRISQTAITLVSFARKLISSLCLDSDSKMTSPRRRFHLAIGVNDIQRSVQDYSHRLGCAPVLVIDHEYALWRNPTLNFSIRKTDEKTAGMVRHLGWEDASAPDFSVETDVNGILWECFTAGQQADEINTLWPRARYNRDSP